jgi:hypothetical protein
MTTKTAKSPFLQGAMMKDVSPFLGTNVAVSAEVFRKNISAINPFAGRESALHVTISNDGEKVLTNTIVEIITSDNLKLVDPGAFFGVIRRHIRVPQLRPGKSVKYKLALHPTLTFTSGVVDIHLRCANWKENHQEFSTRLGVSRQDA